MGDRLQGKVALITGAGNGIGRQTALLFSREGANVVLTDMLEDAVHETARLVKEAGGNAAATVADVTIAEQVEASVKFALATFGKLDILINNAGAGRPPIRLTEQSEEDWDFTMDVNLKGVFLGLKYGIPALKANGGTVVNLASAAGLRGTPKLGPYGAAKAGVVQLTKTAALEWARYGIRVNAVCPSWTKTNMVDSLLNTTPDPAQTEQRMIHEIPLGRLGQPHEIANAVLFLASDESSFITGAILPVDGGLAAQ